MLRPVKIVVVFKSRKSERQFLHEKNGFAEVKIYLDTNLKIILFDPLNNYMGHSN